MVLLQGSAVQTLLGGEQCGFQPPKLLGTQIPLCSNGNNSLLPALGSATCKQQGSALSPSL